MRTQFAISRANQPSNHCRSSNRRDVRTFLSATPQPPCYRRGSTFHSCFVALVSRCGRCAVVNDHFTLSGPFKVSRFIDQYLLNLLANQTYGEAASRGGIPWIAALSALHEAELWLGASWDVNIELTSSTLPQLISLIRFFAVVMIDDSRCCVDEMNVPNISTRRHVSVNDV